MATDFKCNAASEPAVVFELHSPSHTLLNVHELLCASVNIKLTYSRAHPLLDYLISQKDLATTSITI